MKKGRILVLLPSSELDVGLGALHLCHLFESNKTEVKYSIKFIISKMFRAKIFNNKNFDNI